MKIGDCMAEWKNVELGEVVTLKRGYDLPQQKRIAGSVPIFSSSGISGYHNTAMVKGPGVVTGRYGTIGQVFFAGQDFWPLNTTLYVEDFHGNDPEFIYYFLKTLDWNSFTSASAVPGINRNTVHKAPVTVPDLVTQQKIASVLKCLDDKIILNNKINDNLEQQMRMLYKNWFIDLVPFGGIVPGNWRQESIYSLAEIIYGAPFSSKQFNTEGIGKPIIRIRDLKNQQFETYTTEVHPKGYLLQPGDIVVGMDGEFRPYIWGNKEAWLNQRICVFKNKRPQGKAFLYYTIEPLLYAVEQTQVATTVIHIGKKDFDAFKIMLPDEDVLNRFDDLTSPMIDQIVSNIYENKKLEELRDALLPKLMSGEFDVEDVKI